MPEGTSRELLTAAYLRKFADIDNELAKFTAVCGLDLLDEHVVERVLHNDRSLCCTPGCPGFEKMRQLLLMHFLVRRDAVAALGETSAHRLIDEVIVRLRERINPRAGGPLPRRSPHQPAKA